MPRTLRLPPCASRLAAVAFAALLAAGAAQAQQKIRPGLWENTIAMKSGGGQMEAAMAQMREQMAAMTPEQRAQVEAMMARQGIGMGAGRPNTVRTCITPEMASRNDFNPGDSRCRSTGHSRNGNAVKFKFTCDSEQGSSEGEGEFTLVSDTATKGKMWVSATRQGQTQRMEMESTSRWVAADCGDVKPVLRK
ncbi:MAG: DUF3617 domain-containing protein [Rubrivivax sp.]|nr:DUF3617 domain-containing protein [Rubrivivax sp.]